MAPKKNTWTSRACRAIFVEQFPICAEALEWS